MSSFSAASAVSVIVVVSASNTAGFHNIQFSVVLLNHVEMAILYTYHLYVVILLQDIGQAEAGKSFSALNSGFSEVLLVA